MAKLFVRFGCMNSGKTTELLQVAHNYEENNLMVCIIKPGVDSKGKTSVVSRLGVSREVDAIISDKDYIVDKINLENISCILVDEAQFLTRKQILELAMIANIHNVPVIAFALKVNFKAELFEGSKALLEFGQDYETLKTICSCPGCAKRATHNGRMEYGQYVYEGDEVKIDGEDRNTQYNPLCERHYLEKVFLTNTENQREFQKVLLYPKRNNNQ